MRKCVVVLILLSICVLALLLYSCNKVTDSNLVTGNPADPAFVEVNLTMRQSAENSQDAVFDGMDEMFNYLFAPPKAAGVNTDSLFYEYFNGWHHLVLFHTNDTTGSTFHLDDSVQFKDTTGAVVQNPDTLNLGSVQVKVKRYVHLTQYDPYEDFQFKGYDTVFAAAMLVRNADDTTATFDGTASEMAHGNFLHPDSGVECSLDAAVSHSVNSLVILINGDNCPISGQLGAAGSVDIVCPFPSGTVTVSGNWSWFANIGQNTVTIIAQNNTTRWVIIVPKDQFCSSGPVIAREVIPGRFQN
jgi:hypothetical protein